MKCALLLLLVLAACEERRDVRLTFAGRNDLPLGFACIDPVTGRLLLWRAIDTAEQVFDSTVVVDFIHLGGMPGCRPSELLDWCEDPAHSCAPMATERRCIHLPPVGLDLYTIQEAIQMSYQDLAQRVVTDDAPQDPVIVRVVWTAQPCDGDGGLNGSLDFDPAQLIGCVTSCPVQLASVSGDVSLDLPFLPTRDTCVKAVELCAANSIADWAPPPDGGVSSSP